MTEDMQLSFEGRSVRVGFDSAGYPWWVGVDVCGVLGIRKSRDVLSRLPDDERGSVLMDTPGGPQSHNAVNEAGLYRLIFQSRKPAAERFKRWLAHEVLPSLRRTGRYEMVDTPAEPAQLPQDYDGWLALISEARRTYGRSAARRLWDESPLPEVVDHLPSLSLMEAAMAQFVSDFCELVPNSRVIVRTSELLARYNALAAGRRWPLATQNAGARALGRAMPVPRIRSNGVTGYRGIRLA